jgi:hypothetical protein
VYAVGLDGERIKAVVDLPAVGQTVAVGVVIFGG